MTTRDMTVLETAGAWLDAGRAVALATVIETWGSAPQPTGSQLVIDSEANFEGSVSGGCVEGAVIAEAADVIESGKATTLTFGVENETAWQVGLACGGTIRIHVEAVGHPSGRGLQREHIGAILEAHRRRRPVVLASWLESDRRALLGPGGEGTAEGQLATAVDEGLRRDRAYVTETGGQAVFANVFNPALQMVVIGAVHIAQALIPMAQRAGYDVTVVDPRTAFATEQRFGDVRLIAEWPDDALAGVVLDTRTAVVALTHDPKIDDPALTLALAAPCFYIGALGSRRTHGKRFERLTAAGIDEAALARIHAPIGLDIGAEGPVEIAISIMAEVTAALRGKAGGAP